ncbi:catalase A [Ceratocystis pirilliformis]|uniref:Catalase n=1 Tax=Ceratocystis pirilliformis TaxID=259994 RepID=A0ABR3YS03_9PEZI
MAEPAADPHTFQYDKEPFYTTSNGCPVANPEAYQRVGAKGPLLVQDFNLLDLLAHFDRERIPERVVHAKGSGAFGEFEVTDDISDITIIDSLKTVGKKTPVGARFSTVGGEKGSADTARDPRGFSLKFYTSEGNWDWVYNNTPVFFLRDPAKFPTFIHTQKRNPQTNLKDANMFWDYLSTHQESIHQVMILFSDRGTPYSYRHMHGYSGHTYKWQKADGTFNYVQVHVKTNQGIKTLTNEEAGKLSGENPDRHAQDLFESIEKGDYPSWTVYVQTMTPEQAEKFKYSVFDLTKVWPQAEFPLRRFGKLTLNRNHENYHAEIEQMAYSPSHMVPGIEPSADPVLQARLFSYPDTQRYRLGVNYQQIPVNRPLNAFNPWQRDGSMVVDGGYGRNPNYPSSYRKLQFNTNVKVTNEHEVWTGAVTNELFQEVSDADFEQPAKLWEVIGRTEGQQQNLVNNVAAHLSAAQVDIRNRTYEMFGRVNESLGQQIRDATEKKVTEKAAA